VPAFLKGPSSHYDVCLNTSMRRYVIVDEDRPCPGRMRKD
jgi:hypothetical protein